MNELDPSLPNADELVSAYVDGEATADEAARVEADPELMRRVEAFRAVAALSGSAPPLPADYDAARERAIAAALAASSTSAKVTSLAPIQARRSRFAKPMVGVLSAAAVILVLFLGVAVVANLGGGDDSDTAATSGFDVADDTAGDSATAAEPLVERSPADTEAALADEAPAAVGADAASSAEDTGNAPATEAPADDGDDAMDEGDGDADTSSPAFDDHDEDEAGDSDHVLERFASIDDIIASFDERTKTIGPLATTEQFTLDQQSRLATCDSTTADFDTFLFLEEVVLKTTAGDEVPVFVFFDQADTDRPIRLLDTVGCFELP